jgi:hypothetical protein
MSRNRSLHTSSGKLSTLFNMIYYHRASPVPCAALAPVLSYMLGVEGTRPSGLEPEQLKRQIALAARTLLERRLEQSPVLYVVEDLHWADAALVDLLRNPADQLADRRLIILLSHRPEAQPKLLARAAQSIIRLGPFGRRDPHVSGKPVRARGQQGLRPAPTGNVGCCAPAAAGHAAAPPSNAMNSRRLTIIRSPRQHGRGASAEW